MATSAHNVASVESASGSDSDTVRVASAPGELAELKLLRQPLAAAAVTVLLAHHDLAVFWKAQGQAQDYEPPPLDGFFGASHQRISFAFTERRRDSLRSELYHVADKTRFYKTITPFWGEVRITSVARLVAVPGQQAQLWQYLNADSLSKAYTATATFAFREDATAAGAGQYAGTAHLDFYLPPRQAAQLAVTYGMRNSLPAKGAGIEYQGRWVSYHGSRTRSLQVSNDVFNIAPAAWADFQLGERDPTFNPKYAKLGWNHYWENKEWWAEPTRPAISL